jgi:hypothetical protein
MKVIVVSGRKDVCREQTLKWLKKHLSFDVDFLYMRKTEDIREDSIVKEEIYNEYIK